MHGKGLYSVGKQLLLHQQRDRNMARVSFPMQGSPGPTGRVSYSVRGQNTSTLPTAIRIWYGHHHHYHQYSILITELTN